MPITFTYRTEFGLQQRPVRAQDVVDAERELGVVLPQDFKDFLLAHDGPTPTPGWFPAAAAKGVVWCGPIHHFLATAGPAVRRLGKRACCLESLTEASRYGEMLPNHLVVIAQLATQPSTLLLSTAAADYGTVYAWRVGSKMFRPDQLLRVAGSFTEFLGLLAEPPTEPLASFRRAVADHERGTTRRPPPEDYDGPEARGWLEHNQNPAALAVNHFGSTDAARRFVDELYAAGAARVLVPENSIQEDDDLGPYADALVVFLPDDPASREAVCRRCEREMDEPEEIDVNDPNPVFLWWD